MLVKLSIKNFLLISELELDFHHGLSVVTGETGSGKSIIIDALMLLFGAKFSVNDIRHNEDITTFAAEFELSNQWALNYLQEHDLINSESPHTLLCRRIIDIAGKNKAYINGVSVTNAQIKELASFILDIHTQHASITLLKPDVQRRLLDEYAGVSKDVVTLGNIFKQLIDTQKELTIALADMERSLQKRQELEEAIAELTALNLTEHDWIELNARHKELSNVGSILETLTAVSDILNSDQNSFDDYSGQQNSAAVLKSMATINTYVARIETLAPSLSKPLQQLLASITIELNELDSVIHGQIKSLDTDPDALQTLEDRIQRIFELGRKYRISPDQIPSTVAAWQTELADLVAHSDVSKLQEQEQVIREEYQSLARKISTARAKCASTLSSKVTELLHNLALSGTFNIGLVPLRTMREYGIEDVEYQVCFNQGLPLHPLASAASGGELSRTALALYLVLSLHNPPEIIIFDEIDVGIGGKIAAIVGKMLHELGGNKQVICITHQPQTASYGHNHLVVQKLQHEGNTQVVTQYVDNESRINEIARMLSGVKITSTTLSHAREMLHLSGGAVSTRS